MKIQKFMEAVKEYINYGNKSTLRNVMKLWNELTIEEQIEAEQLSKATLHNSISFKNIKESGKFTNELAASLFHYGQTLRVLALLGHTKALNYEKLNFKSLLKSLGYDYDAPGFNISKEDEFGNTVLVLLEIASKIGEFTVDCADESDCTKLNLHLDALQSFYIELGLDPVEIGIRAKHLIDLSKKALDLDRKEGLPN